MNTRLFAKRRMGVRITCRHINSLSSNPTFSFFFFFCSFPPHGCVTDNPPMARCSLLFVCCFRCFHARSLSLLLHWIQPRGRVDVRLPCLQFYSLAPDGACTGTLRRASVSSFAHGAPFEVALSLQSLSPSCVNRTN